MEYIRAPAKAGCVFCRSLDGSSDREALVLHRGKAVFVLMNRYPYGAGHLMVAPLRHTANPEELSPEEASELWRLMLRAKAALGAVFYPDGYNVGFNLGKAAGAGVADHLHLHVVPRWVGDVNFLPLLGQTTVMSQYLAEMYDSLAPQFESGEE